MEPKSEGSISCRDYLIRNAQAIHKTQEMKESFVEVSSSCYECQFYKETEEYANYILNIAVAEGKWYYEAHIESDEIVDLVLGWDSLDTIRSADLAEGVGSNAYSYGYQPNPGILQHDGCDHKQYKLFSTGDTLGVAIDLDSNTIMFYHNGLEMKGFSNIRDNTQGPFYPTISVVLVKMKWFIQSKDFKYTLPNYKGIGDNLDLSKVNLIRFSSKITDMQSIELHKGILRRLEREYGPIMSESVPTNDVAFFLIYIAKNMSPELKDHVFQPYEMDELRMNIIAFVKSQIVSTLINIFHIYISQSISKWKEPTLDPTSYPLLSSIRSRTSSTAELESKLKLQLIMHGFAEKHLRETPEVPYWESSSPLFKSMQPLIQEDLDVDTIKNRVFKLVDLNEGEAPYLYCKIDIHSLQRWRKGLTESDPTQHILDILFHVDLPIADFLEKPISLSFSLFKNYLYLHLGKIMLEYTKLVQDYRKAISQERAAAFLQDLKKGGEERKAVLSDPQNQPILLFYSGNLDEIAEKFGDFLSETISWKSSVPENASIPTPLNSPSPVPPSSTPTPPSPFPLLSNLTLPTPVVSLMKKLNFK